MKERIEWIDLAKGFSIILVVYGHSGLSAVPFLGDWFAAFICMDVFTYYYISSLGDPFDMHNFVENRQSF